ncbi:hypothetical protein CYLTODRAFT_495483, partial [Cylindrobasidium torrendii FP15055 ss-10]
MTMAAKRSTVFLPPLARFAAYLGRTTEATYVVESTDCSGSSGAFMPSISSANTRTPLPFAFYVRTREQAQVLCNTWCDFLNTVDPFPLYTVSGGTTVFDVGASHETSPLIVEFCRLGFDKIFDDILQNSKPIFALPYCQYPGLYINEDAARLAVQNCAHNYRGYNLVTNSFATAFETVMCNSYCRPRGAAWRVDTVPYDFCIPSSIVGGPLYPLPPVQPPLPVPGAFVVGSSPSGWHTPSISSSPFVSPVATPRRDASPAHASQSASQQDTSRRLFTITPAMNTPASSPVKTPKPLPSPCDAADLSSPTRSSPRSRLHEHTGLKTLPENLRRLLPAFYPNNLDEAIQLFREAQDYDDLNAATSDMVADLPPFISAAQFIYGLSYIFETGRSRRVLASAEASPAQRSSQGHLSVGL